MNKAFLIILDGFGYSEETENNAIYKANTEFYDGLLNDYPHSLVKTDGDAVGLPEGVMGNSEVGHLTIGSGRKIYQDLSKISKYFEEEKLNQHPVFNKLSAPAGDFHLLGLVSDGGVHSSIEHLKSLVKGLLQFTDKKIFIHMFSDGRDTAPTSGLGFSKTLEEDFQDQSRVQLVSVVGRFYAMDRDKRWERIEMAYRLLAEGISSSGSFESVSEAIEDSYSKEETDEFIKPRKTNQFSPITEEDHVVFFNFRSDRARELSEAFTNKDFKEFQRTNVLSEENWYTFTRYKEDFKFPVLFEKEAPKQILGELVSDSGKKQLRCAETEKYAHVTFFFNGGKDEVFKGEDRILVDSPKDVATYDLKPEMSAPEVTDKLVEAIQKTEYELVVVNYANGDMVGHTGVESAAIQAVECLDRCLSKLIPAALKEGYEILITADHGNCEEMLNRETGKPFTQHSMNQVPLLWIGERAKMGKLKDGGLADIAPSILDIMGLEKPAEMTGQSLLV